MIQLYASSADGKRLVVYGVTRKNIEKLTAGQPMLLRMMRPVDEGLVVFGETKPDILRQLKEAGMEVLNAHMAAAAADPL